MTILDTTKTFTLTVNSVNVWDYLVKGSLRCDLMEAGQVGTLSFILEDYDSVISIREWHTVYWTADGTNLFGGYVREVVPTLMSTSERLKYQVDCDSWETDLTKTEKITARYVDSTCETIIQDIFLDSGLSDYNTVTYVDTGSTLDSFYADKEEVSEIMDKLATISQYEWWIDPDKNLHFTSSATNTAPFSVKDKVSDANFTTSFPVDGGEGSITKKTTSDDIINKVIVYGGEAIDQTVYTDTFTGNGTKYMYKLSHEKIGEVLYVTVDSVIQKWGVDWWYNDFNVFNVFVDPGLGSLRFNLNSPPANGATIVCAYRKKGQLSVTVVDDDSYTYYGRYFVYTHFDSSITSESYATEIATAILAEKSTATPSGRFSVRRLGLKPGQRVDITSVLLGLSGYYTIRKVTLSLNENSTGVIAEVEYGGRKPRLSNLLKTDPKAAYTESTNPALNGTAQIVHVGWGGDLDYGVILVGDPTRTFSPP